MPLAPPRSLSPSKVAAFKNCPLAFRLSAIDRIPQPPSAPATLGTMVHRALELLFCHSPEDRHVGTALECLQLAHEEMQLESDFVELNLDADGQRAFLADATALVQRYFDLEDPRAIRPIGLELLLEAKLAGLLLRGIIDRLELDENGGLVVTDYKTGRVPSVVSEQSRLGGVHFYAFLCEEVFGQRPSRIQLLYLSKPVAIITEPSPQSTRALRQRTTAIWQAIERACQRDDFRPHPSPLCGWCSYQHLCPAMGGGAEAQTIGVTKVNSPTTASAN